MSKRITFQNNPQKAAKEVWGKELSKDDIEALDNQHEGWRKSYKLQKELLSVDSK